jgi:hypothetical protein
VPAHVMMCGAHEERLWGRAGMMLSVGWFEGGDGVWLPVYSCEVRLGAECGRVSHRGWSACVDGERVRCSTKCGSV